MLVGVPVTRLKQLLHFDNVIHPEYRWDQNVNKTWDYSLDMNSIFSRRDMVLQTCPLHEPQPGEGKQIYRQFSNISGTQSPNINVSHLVLQLSLPNPLKSGVKSRMKV